MSVDTDSVPEGVPVDGAAARLRDGAGAYLDGGKNYRLSGLAAGARQAVLVGHRLRR